MINTKRFSCFFVLNVLALAPVLASADDCKRANELRFIRSGTSLGVLLSRAGKADVIDTSTTVRLGNAWVNEETHIYNPLCGNQTIYTIRVRDGVVTRVDKTIQR